MSVSDNIRAIRIAKGLSQAEVARRYGTSPEFYHRLEKKKNQSISWEQLTKVADALGVSYTELIGAENTKPDVRELRARIVQLEAENKALRTENEDFQRQIVIYEPLAKMVNLLFSDPARIEDFAKKATTGKVGKSDIEAAFPDIKAAFDNPNKETK